MLKLKDGDARRICEISSELTTKTSQPHSWRRSDFSIANFEQILQVTLVFPLFVFEQVSYNWEGSRYQSAFTYSKLTIETLEQGVKYVQS